MKLTGDDLQIIVWRSAPIQRWIGDGVATVFYFDSLPHPAEVVAAVLVDRMRYSATLNESERSITLPFAPIYGTPIDLVYVVNGQEGA